MFSGIAGEEQRVALTLFTDAYVIRGHISTRQRRVTDMLNQAENNFLVLNEVLLDEFGSRTVASRADFAQVNLDAVLFAVADTPVEPIPELRTPKVPEHALISIPPFKVTGRIHLLPERDLRNALEELTGRFLPVTEATYWSEAAGEARTAAPMIAVNHARAQILAPHREVDPWAGLDRGAAAEGQGPATERQGPATEGQGPATDGQGPATEGQVPPAPAESPYGGTQEALQDPWGGGVIPPGEAPPGEAPPGETAAGQDPWRDLQNR